jgi:hypothetical protein
VRSGPEILRELTGAGEEFRKAGVAMLLGDPKAPKMELVWQLRPKDLTGKSKGKKKARRNEDDEGDS